MKSITDYIAESLETDIDVIIDIDEANKCINDTKKFQPIRIITGDHVEDRKNERHVTDKDIINAVYRAKTQIFKMLKSGELDVWNKDWGDKTHNFILCDTAKDKEYPVSVVGFVKWTDPKFKKCTVVIKTVATYKDFAALLRRDSEYEKHIYLY